MSKYSEALGILEFEVGGLSFSIKPKKGDNRKLLKIQSRSGQDTGKLMEDFIPYIVEIISREEDLATEDREDLELFVEQNVMEFFKEVMVGFKWTTREKLDEAEKKQLDNFREGLNAPKA